MKAERKPLVALGVTGCIGAYKAAEILRRLQDRDLDIQPILTEAATHFVTPYVLQTLASRKAITGLWDEPDRVEVEHISLSDASDLLLVAPATANIIAKFAHGIADDFLSTFYLSTESPVVIAPAMNTKMWGHPATRDNVEILHERGVTFVEPGVGYLACGWEGEGRLAAVEDIVDAALFALRRNKSLAGKRVLISGGPTAEAIDSLRFISNRSSGNMATALAWEARARGAEVKLVLGPVSARSPQGVSTVHVRSAAEMKEAIESELSGSDVLVMAAAVADFRPVSPAEGKIRKEDGVPTIVLERTDDILAGIGKRKEHPFIVGFAAESGDLKEHALRKLKSKGADLIVANPIGGENDVLGADDTEGLLIAADGKEKTVRRCTKSEMSQQIWDEVERLLRI